MSAIWRSTDRVKKQRSRIAGWDWLCTAAPQWRYPTLVLCCSPCGSVILHFLPCLSYLPLSCSCSDCVLCKEKSNGKFAEGRGVVHQELLMSLLHGHARISQYRASHLVQRHENDAIFSNSEIYSPNVFLCALSLHVFGQGGLKPACNVLTWGSLVSSAVVTHVNVLTMLAMQTAQGLVSVLSLLCVLVLSALVWGCTGVPRQNLTLRQGNTTTGCLSP